MMHKRCMLSYYTQRRIVSVRNLIRIGSTWVNQFFYASIAARKASNSLRKVKLPDGKFSSKPDEVKAHTIITIAHFISSLTEKPTEYCFL
ncbi:hypothetical protein QJS04_geneDACA019738 [Acorus gramineus]|uniref:Uncharacterized protein n=1 Tax=Acorus gramineus TaxID=55184 RepID=A0AAV9BV69_ACOGR|nr:hypothetical protein QJS04_geneDACA019738 [Acorus gramineus]